MLEKQSIAAEYLAQLVSRWGPKKTARQFGVTLGSLRRWLRKGPPVKRLASIETAYRRSTAAIKAAATRKRAHELRLTQELASLATAEQMMRRLLELGIDQPQLEPIRERIAEINRQLNLIDWNIYHVLNGLSEAQLERRKQELMRRYGLTTSRELYVLFHSPPSYGIEATTL